MEEEFLALLTGSAAIIALCPVGSVSWGEHPQGLALPAIVLNVISNSNGHTMSGPDRLYEARVQCDVYATTFGAAKILSRAAMATLDGYRGGKFQGVFHAGSRDSREGGANDDERRFRVSIDFMTKWSE